MSASPTASTEVENSVGTGNIMLKACSWFASHSVACLWGKAVRHYRRCTKSSGSSCEVFANPQSLGRHFPKSWPRLHSHKDVLFISPLCWLDCCQRSRRYSHGLLENVYFPKISAVNSHTVHLSLFTGLLSTPYGVVKFRDICGLRLDIHVVAAGGFHGELLSPPLSLTNSSKVRAFLNLMLQRVRAPATNHFLAALSS